jgi:hypothetical protein
MNTRCLRFTIILGIVLLSFLTGSCSKAPTFPNLSAWLGKEDSPIKLVKLEEAVYAVLMPNADGVVDRVCLVRKGAVIVDVEMYGNGNKIQVASANRPALIVNESEGSLNMIRDILNPDGSHRFIVYGADGQIASQVDSVKK